MCTRALKPMHKNVIAALLSQQKTGGEKMTIGSRMGRSTSVGKYRYHKVRKINKPKSHNVNNLMNLRVSRSYKETYCTVPLI